MSSILTVVLFIIFIPVAMAVAYGVFYLIVGGFILLMAIITGDIDKL